MEGTLRTNQLNQEMDDSENSVCPYFAALGHSSTVLSDAYGTSRRQIPAHVPYPIDVKIMEKL